MSADDDLARRLGEQGDQPEPLFDLDPRDRLARRSAIFADRHRDTYARADHRARLRASVQPQNRRAGAESHGDGRTPPTAYPTKAQHGTGQISGETRPGRNHA